MSTATGVAFGMPKLCFGCILSPVEGAQAELAHSIVVPGSSGGSHAAIRPGVGARSTG